MVADAAAYAVLGLEPGADWAAMERAYRELIKVHHPDRSGGDAQRATEIIHAYRELKRARDAKGALILVDEAPAGRRGYDWPWAALAVAAVGALVFTLGPLKPPRADRPVAAARAEPRPARPLRGVRRCGGDAAGPRPAAQPGAFQRARRDQPPAQRRGD